MKINIESIKNEEKQKGLETPENFKEIVNLTMSPNGTNRNLGVYRPFEVESTTLVDIEIVYNKYFSDSLQNNIVIAKILCMTFLPIDLFGTQLNELSNCIDETVKRLKMHDVC